MACCVSTACCTYGVLCGVVIVRSRVAWRCVSATGCDIWSWPFNLRWYGHLSILTWIKVLYIQNTFTGSEFLISITLKWKFFFLRNSFNRMQEHFQINIFYSIRAVACIAVCLFFLEIEMIKHGLQNKNKDHVFGTYL